MSISKVNALTNYTIAKEKIQNIVTSYNSSEEQIGIAQTAFEKLADDFIDNQALDFATHTIQYQKFINYMNEQLAELNNNPGPSDVLNYLSTFVSEINTAANAEDGN